MPTGVTIENNGVPVSVGDQITIADINAGNITATTDASTTEIFISYEVVKTDGDDYNGLDDLFPPDGVDYVANPLPMVVSLQMILQMEATMPMAVNLLLILTVQALI